MQIVRPFAGAACYVVARSSHIIDLDSRGRSRECQSGSSPGVATPTASQARQRSTGCNPVGMTPKKNTAPRIRWIRRAAVPPRTIRKNLRGYTGPGVRVFQMICLSIVPLGLVACCKNASFSPSRRNLLTECIFIRSIFWRFEYISSLGLLSGLLSLTGNH